MLGSHFRVTANALGFLVCGRRDGFGFLYRSPLLALTDCLRVTLFGDGNVLESQVPPVRWACLDGGFAILLRCGCMDQDGMRSWRSWLRLGRHDANPFARSTRLDSRLGRGW